MDHLRGVGADLRTGVSDRQYTAATPSNTNTTSSDSCDGVGWSTYTKQGKHRNLLAQPQPQLPGSGGPPEKGPLRALWKPLRGPAAGWGDAGMRTRLTLEAYTPLPKIEEAFVLFITELLRRRRTWPLLPPGELPAVTDYIPHPYSSLGRCPLRRGSSGKASLGRQLARLTTDTPADSRLLLLILARAAVFMPCMKCASK